MPLNDTQDPRQHKNNWQPATGKQQWCEWRFLCILNVEDECQVATPASVAIEVLSHEDTITAGAALAASFDHLAIVDAIVVEDGHGVLLVLVVGLLGLGEDFLLALLGTTQKVNVKVQSGLVSNAVIVDGACVAKLLATENDALVAAGDA